MNDNLFHPTIERTNRLMRELMEAIEPAFPDGTGIALIAFEKTGQEGKRVNYIGNVARPEILKALKEIVARWEGRAMAPTETHQ